MITALTYPLQISTVQVLACHIKSAEKIMLNQHFLMLISDFFEPVGPPLLCNHMSNNTIT